MAENPAVIAFNTANLVGRVTNYCYELNRWGDQHQATIAATDENEWRRICHEVADAGYRAVEVWEAHAAPESLDERRAAVWRAIMAETGLRPVAYAGHLSRETAEICQWLEIPHIDGAIGGLSPGEAGRLCAESGVAFNLENHPQTCAAEILAAIGGGDEWLGACVDTGWLGTQGVSAPRVIRDLGSHVRHVHVKDVRAVGRHETCALGAGIVDIEGCLHALRDIGYSGIYSWEDEPEDRNPFDSAVRNREWLEERLK